MNGVIKSSALTRECDPKKKNYEIQRCHELKFKEFLDHGTIQKFYFGLFEGEIDTQKIKKRAVVTIAKK